LIQTWIGFSANDADAVCNTGPADLRNTDSGYFGAGIYSTLQPSYARTFSKQANPEGEFCLLLCWVAVGNVYPICRELDYPNGQGISRFYELIKNGIALEPGFDSHCACVSLGTGGQAAKFDCANPENPFGDDVADEIVIKESAQVLPYCMVYFKK